MGQDLGSRGDDLYTTKFFKTSNILLLVVSALSLQQENTFLQSPSFLLFSLLVLLLLVIFPAVITPTSTIVTTYFTTSISAIVTASFMTSTTIDITTGSTDNPLILPYLQHLVLQTSDTHGGLGSSLGHRPQRSAVLTLK